MAYGLSADQFPQVADPKSLMCNAVPFSHAPNPNKMVSRISRPQIPQCGHQQSRGVEAYKMASSM